MADLATIARYSDSALWDATIPELPNHYAGKVRDNYDLPDGRRILVTSDRLSAFDMVLTALPLKGQVLTQIARFWFDKTADICKNHVIEYPDPNVVVGQRLAMLPVEIVVRDYLAGTTSTSVWSMYKTGKREMYGIRLPDGLRENQKLPETIITPTTKGEEGAHDEPLAPADIVGRGLLPKAQWDEVTHHALALFARGRELARARGLILVDTKYEFGVDPSGHVVLADEIHTPDSSRYWYLASYEEQFRKGERPLSFDKDVVRNWVAARCDPYKEKVPEIPKDVIVGAAKVYVDVCETITGGFSWPDRNVAPLQRIRANLKKYF